jgi:hypothetical protein
MLRIPAVGNDLQLSISEIQTTLDGNETRPKMS